MELHKITNFQNCQKTFQMKLQKKTGPYKQELLGVHSQITYTNKLNKMRSCFPLSVNRCKWYICVWQPVDQDDSFDLCIPGTVTSSSLISCDATLELSRYIYVVPSDVKFQSNYYTTEMVVNQFILDLFRFTPIYYFQQRHRIVWQRRKIVRHNKERS